ncbi:MAG: trigger factor [Hydrotalea sp.]|nr:trigger factor [Hydrotalea sp.]
MINIKETSKQKLSRQYEISVKKADLLKALDKELAAIQPTAQMPGFRVGKVPLDILKKNYSDRVMGDVIQKLLQDGLEQIQKDFSVKVADRPEIIKINHEEAIKLKADLLAEIAINLLPPIPTLPIEKIAITRYRVKADEKEIKEQIKENLENIAKNYRESKKIDDRQETKKGDLVVMDFEGFVDDKPFAGGKGEDFELELGSGQFIAGFEDQLIGKKLNEELSVKVTFPKHYHEESLSEKPAVFKTTIKAIKEYLPVAIDDEFAKKVGLKDLKELEDMMEKQITGQADQQSNDLLKRQLLDQLHQLVDFELPEKMVENDFQAVFPDVKHAFEHDHLEEEDKGKDLKTLEKEYRAIAARRVKLGLILNDVGEKAAVKVSENEMRQVIMNRAMQYPPQEREKFLKAVGQNQNLQVQLSLPVFEQKVVDHLLTQIKITDKDLSPSEFIKKAETIHNAPSR